MKGSHRNFFQKTSPIVYKNRRRFFFVVACVTDDKSVFFKKLSVFVPAPSHSSGTLTSSRALISPRHAVWAHAGALSCCGGRGRRRSDKRTPSRRAISRAYSGRICWRIVWRTRSTRTAARPCGAGCVWGGAPSLAWAPCSCSRGSASAQSPRYGAAGGRGRKAGLSIQSHILRIGTSAHRFHLQHRHAVLSGRIGLLQAPVVGWWPLWHVLLRLLLGTPLPPPSLLLSITKDAGSGGTSREGRCLHPPARKRGIRSQVVSVQGARN